ncbi:uncharacterized protein METZ01_LOCUS5356 [marine metagenome]|uniref:TrmE-type G domain-containing protein n=1 Tax=marine metagenome TaxID=408172 RepID=A0A381ND59_9ZZZZ
MNKKEKTYYALSSPPGRSATASIRISGPRSLATLSKLTTKNKHVFKHGTTRVCNIFNKNNILVDKVVVVFYHKPKSYTGEDMVEIHTHGNPLITHSIFNELSNFGLRPADPGEFTRNAYLNNKIDLVQAEAVLSLINAQTNKGVELSISSASGSLSSHLKELRGSLINALSHVEYELDISETDNHRKTLNLIVRDLEKTTNHINNLIKSYNTLRLLRDGIRVIIVGAPNVGKSTLFNAILGQDRAIVTSRPGTTRDAIESALQILNYSIFLVDTAGIRETKKLIEGEGIKKTNLEIRNADVIYHVLDPTTKKTINRLPTTTKTITIYSKSDLLSEQEKENLIKGNSEAVVVSGKLGTGLKKLTQKTAKAIESSITQKESVYITSKRQQTILLNALVALNSAQDPEVLGQLELISIHLKDAINQFDWLLGKTTADDVLNTIFSDFCVGK